jgi:hypothetical protein
LTRRHCQSGWAASTTTAPMARGLVVDAAGAPVRTGPPDGLGRTLVSKAVGALLPRHDGRREGRAMSRWQASADIPATIHGPAVARGFVAALLDARGLQHLTYRAPAGGE